MRAWEKVRYLDLDLGWSQSEDVLAIALGK